MRFREFMDQEQSILAQLPHMSISQQVALDKSLHQDAINKGSFGVDGRMLAQDMPWKDKVLDVLNGQEKDPEVINGTIARIKRDITSHQNRSPSTKTGSDAWHEAWIRVYQNWLSMIRTQ